MMLFKPTWKSNNIAKALKWVEDHKQDKKKLEEVALCAELVEVRTAAIKCLAEQGALDELADKLCPEAFAFMSENKLLEYAILKPVDSLKESMMYIEKYGGSIDPNVDKHTKEIRDEIRRVNTRKSALAWNQLKKIAGPDSLARYYGFTASREGRWEAEELWLQRLDRSDESVIEDCHIPSGLKIALAEKRNSPQLKERLCKMGIHAFGEIVERSYDPEEDRFTIYRFSRCVWCGKEKC